MPSIFTLDFAKDTLTGAEQSFVPSQEHFSEEGTSEGQGFIVQNLCFVKHAHSAVSVSGAAQPTMRAGYAVSDSLASRVPHLSVSIVITSCKQKRKFDDAQRPRRPI